MMKRRLIAKRVLSLIAVMALVFSSGCGRGQAPDPVGAKGNVRPASVDTEKTTEKNAGADGDSATVLHSETLSLPDSDVKLRRSAMAGGYIYLCGADANGGHRFYRMDSEGKISRLDLSWNAPVENFSVDDSGNIYIINTDESGALRIVWLNADGGSQDISAPAIANAGIITSFAAMGAGFLVDTGSEILALDKDGGQIKSLGGYQGGIWLVRLSDDNCIIVYSRGAGANIPSSAAQPQRIDRIDGDFNVSGSAELTGAYTSFFGGLGGELFTSLEGNFYEYDYNSGSLTRRFDSAATEIIPEYYLGNNSYFAIERGAPIKLTAEEQFGIKELVLAGYNIDSRIATAAQQFNATNSGYIISIDDYARYDEYDNTGAGELRFAADIISGHTPDIYSLNTNFMDMRNSLTEKYAAKGLLCDLTPFFEADSEVEIYDKLFEYMRCGDGLYQVSMGFMLPIVCGAPEVVSKPFTVDKLVELTNTYSAQAVLGPGMTRDSFIRDVLSSMHNELCSATDKTCNFTSEEFISMLAITAQLPDTQPPFYMPIESAANGERLILENWLGPFFVDYIAWYHTIFGDDVCITGFPSAQGHGAQIMPHLSVGMSSTSENKEGVWEFFKFLLSEDMQENYFGRWFFPAEKKALNAFIETFIRKHIEEPASVALFDGGKLTGSIDEATARATIKEIFDSITSVAVYDSEIYDIIMRECGALWSGDRSPEETAKQIQSRVSIYLAEQYG